MMMMTMKMTQARVSSLLLFLVVCIGSITAFSPASSLTKLVPVVASTSSSTPPRPLFSLLIMKTPRSENERDADGYTANDVSLMMTASQHALLRGAALSLAIIATLPFLGSSITTPPSPAYADEWGKETEAPTLFTGETVMICKKRGPLGACLETTVRTSENDNDKALSYFKDPAPALKLRRQQDIDTLNQESDGNELIQKLRRQSLDNKEKNDLAVLQKTLMNDRGASFGPFDRQVVILNTDGVTFTLLQNPQAMRLKDAGYIDDQRRFIIQPSKEVIEDALVAKEGSADEGLGGAIRGFFGGGGGSEGDKPVIEGVDGSNTVVQGEVDKE